MADELIATIPKNALEQIRVQVRIFKGRMFCDCRVYFEADPGKWIATKKGVAIGPDSLDEVIEALRKAKVKCV